MSKIICVTNRLFCDGDYFEQIEAIAKWRPAMIVLREKDLNEEEYERIAVKVISICKKYEVLCVLHNFEQVAFRLKHRAIHLPLHILKNLNAEERKYFSVLGSSCHSLADAKLAQELGCTYIFAGHIYETDCKKGVKGRGIPFLEEICNAVSIPVYGIGGINPNNFSEVIGAGASGAAIMSGFMRAEDVERVFTDLRVKDV